MFQIKLANKKSYKTSIGRMNLRLAKLQKLNKTVQKIRAAGLNRYKNVNKVLHH